MKKTIYILLCLSLATINRDTLGTIFINEQPAQIIIDKNGEFHIYQNCNTLQEAINQFMEQYPGELFAATDRTLQDLNLVNVDPISLPAHETLPIE
jgi:hypothetical protein